MILFNFQIRGVSICENGLPTSLPWFLISVIIEKTLTCHLIYLSQSEHLAFIGIWMMTLFFYTVNYPILKKDSLSDLFCRIDHDKLMMSVLIDSYWYLNFPKLNCTGSAIQARRLTGFHLFAFHWQYWSVLRKSAMVKIKGCPCENGTASTFGASCGSFARKIQNVIISPLKIELNNTDKYATPLLPTFYAKQITKIQAFTQSADLRHVPYLDNPTDLVSRGQMPQVFSRPNI